MRVSLMLIESRRAGRATENEESAMLEDKNNWLGVDPLYMDVYVLGLST